MTTDKKNLFVKALPFQVLEYPGGVLVRRGDKKLSFTGADALPKILLILSLCSAEAIAFGTLQQKINRNSGRSSDQMLQALLSAGLLIVESRVSKTPLDNFDIFLSEQRSSKQHLIDRLTAQNILLVAVNRLSLLIYAQLYTIGVRNISVLDDSSLRSSQTKTLLVHPEIQAAFESAVYPQLGQADRDTESLLAHHSVIACSDFGGQALLLPWNSWCVDNKKHFYPVALESMIGYAGPLTIPDQTACLNCLRQRQNSHLTALDLKELLEVNAQAAEPVLSIHPSALEMLANTAVFELTQFYAGGVNPRPDHLAKIDLKSGTMDSKRVLKLPRCRICSRLNRSQEIQVNRMTPLSNT